MVCLNYKLLSFCAVVIKYFYRSEYLMLHVNLLQLTSSSVVKLFGHARNRQIRLFLVGFLSSRLVSVTFFCFIWQNLASVTC